MVPADDCQGVRLQPLARTRRDRFKVNTSVIVVSYRRHRWLDPCLSSVVGQADEVILIDNGSPGGAVGAVGRRLGAVVETLPKNRGFAAGVNAGLRRARRDVVALLNDDAVAGPGWLATAAALLEDPSVAAVGPKILLPWRFVEIRLDVEPHFAPGDPRPLGQAIQRVQVDGVDVPLGGLTGSGVHRLEQRVEGDRTRQWRWTSGSGPIFVPVPEDRKGSAAVVDGEPVRVEQVVDLITNAGSYLSTNGHGGDYGFGAPDDGAFDVPAERFATTGAAMAARAETFAGVGGFAESYFAYYEDLDWCWRSRLAGSRCLYDPTCTVRHVGGATTGGPSSDRVRYLAARNRMQTLARNAPLPVVWSQLRSSADRPASGMILPIVNRVSLGLMERRRLARGRSNSPREVWAAWAGRDECLVCRGSASAVY
jgi:GT2 family glycosyltransferase